MYKRNIEARSHNHCCRGKTISIAYSQCVCSLSYPACKAHTPCYIVICGLSGSTAFSTLSHKRHDFRKYIIDHKIGILIFSTTFDWNIYFKKNSSSWYHKCTQVFMQSTRCSCQILMKLEFSPQILEKYSNMNLYENSSSESRVVPCEQTDRPTWRS